MFLKFLSFYLLEEKISIFERFQQTVTMTGANGLGTLPANYRMGSLHFNTGTRFVEIEHINLQEVNQIINSPLTTPTTERPVYIKRGETAATYNDLYLRPLRGEDVSTEYDLLKAGGLLTDKQETAIEKINVRAQSQSVFEQESARANRLLSIGLNGVTQADIDGYENTEVKNALQLQFDRKEEAK